jgi:hypothetical protein
MNNEQLVVDLARELYDRFVMGGWEPQDAYPQIRAMLKAAPHYRGLETEPSAEKFYESYPMHVEGLRAIFEFAEAYADHRGPKPSSETAQSSEVEGHEREEFEKWELGPGCRSEQDLEWNQSLNNYRRRELQREWATWKARAELRETVQGHGVEPTTHIDFFGGSKCTCKKGIHGRITPTQKAESCPVHGYIGKNGRRVKPARDS